MWHAITIAVKMSGAFNRGRNYEARYELVRSQIGLTARTCVRTDVNP